MPNNPKICRLCQKTSHINGFGYNESDKRKREKESGENMVTLDDCDVSLNIA